MSLAAQKLLEKYTPQPYHSALNPWKSERRVIIRLARLANFLALGFRTLGAILWVSWLRSRLEALHRWGIGVKRLRRDSHSMVSLLTVPSYDKKNSARIGREAQELTLFPFRVTACASCKRRRGKLYKGLPLIMLIGLKRQLHTDCRKATSRTWE